MCGALCREQRGHARRPRRHGERARLSPASSGALATKDSYTAEIMPSESVSRTQEQFPEGKPRSRVVPLDQPTTLIGIEYVAAVALYSYCAKPSYKAIPNETRAPATH